MDDLAQLEIGRAEWVAWRKLCDLLEATGAVTSDDLSKSLGASGTKGLEVLDAIRDWGEALVALRGGESDA